MLWADILLLHALSEQFLYTGPKLEFPIHHQMKFDRKCHVSNAVNDHGGIIMIGQNFLKR